MTAPTIPSSQVFSIGPNSTVGTFIGYILAIDSANSPLNYIDATTPSQSFFSISASGIITLISSNPPSLSVITITVTNSSGESSTGNVNIITNTGSQLYQTPYLYFGYYNAAYFMPFPGIGNLNGTTGSSNDTVGGSPTGLIQQIKNTSGTIFGNNSNSTGGGVPQTDPATEYFGANWAFIVGNFFCAGVDQIYLSPFSVSNSGDAISITGEVVQTPYPPGSCATGATSAFVAGNRFYYMADTGSSAFCLGGGCTFYAPINGEDGTFEAAVEVKTFDGVFDSISYTGESFGPYWAFISNGVFYFGNGSGSYYAPYSGGTNLDAPTQELLDASGGSITGAGWFVYQNNYYYSANGQTFYAPLTSPGQLGVATEIQDSEGASFAGFWMFLSFNAISSPPIIDANQTFYIQKDANVGAIVGYISASNLNGSTATFTEVNSANSYFQINASGVISLVKNLNTSTTQTISIQATTPYGTSSITSISIIIQSILLPQTFGMSPTLQPNSNFGAVYLNSDLSYTFNISGDSSGLSFQISSSGQLSYTTLNPTVGSTYTFTVNAVGTVTHSATMTVVVGTTLPFSFPVGQSFSASPTQASGTNIGIVSFDNPVGATVSFTFPSGDLGSPPYTYFSLNSSTCALTSAVTPIPPSGALGYSLIVQETNSNTSTTIVVYVFNPGPQISSQTLASINANTYTQITSIDDISAFDVNGSAITFDITSVIDPSSNIIPSQTLFQLSENQLEVQSGATLVSGNYIVNITATAAGISNSADITVPVSAYNAPTIDGGQNFYLNITAVAGDFVGSIGASALGATLVFSDVSGTPSSYFTIHKTGSITVSTTLPQDIVSPQTISIQVADSEGAVAQANINVYILSVLFPQTFEIISTAQAGPFATFSLDGAFQQYTLSTTSLPIFLVNSNGQLIYDASSPLGDIGTNYEIVVTALDNITTATHFATMTINVVADALFSIFPGQSFLAVPGQPTIGLVSYENPSGGTVTFDTLANSDPTNAAFFSISTSGVLSVTSTSVPVDRYPITVTANGVSESIVVVTSGPQLQNQTFNITTVFGTNNAIGTIFVSGSNGDPITLVITPSNPMFTLAGDVLMTTSTTLTAGVESLTIQATTSAGLANTATITVNITDYEGPSITSSQVFYIKKDLPSGSFVGYISALDPNGGNITFTYGSSSPSSPTLFSVTDAGGLYTASALTLDTQTITVNVANSGGLSTTGTVIINMISVLLNQTFDINNSSSAGVFATILIDGNVSEYTFAMPTPTLPFSIDSATGNLSYSGGSLTAVGTSYSLGITSTKGSVVHSATMTINVTSDALFAIIPGQTFVVKANQTAVGNVSYDNPNGSAVTFNALSLSGDAALFSIAASGTLTVNTLPITPGTYTFAVQSNIGSSANITVIVIANGPQVQDQTFNITTNFGVSKELGTIFASDPDGDQPTLSITADSDTANTNFELVGSALNTTSTAILEPGIATLTIEALSLATGLSNTATITINITLYAYPTIAPNQEFYVRKNKPINSFVGYISAIDPNGGSLIFSDETIYSVNTQYFTVHESGAIFTNQLLSPVSLNAQTLLINVTNSGGLSPENLGTITINIISVLLDQTFEINAQTPINKTFATILINDNASTYTLSITLDNSGLGFTLNENNQLSYTTGTPILGTQYSITVLATSTTTSVTHTGTMTISVTNDTSFTIIPGQIFTIKPNQQAVGNISYDNPEGSVVTFDALTGTNAALFSIDPNSGALTVNSTPIAVGSYTFNAQATGLGSPQLVTVNVVANGPQVQDQTFNITTNFGVSKELGTIFASDPDGNQPTLSITTPNANFELVGASLQTTSNANLTNETVTLIIKAQSNVTPLFSTATITINIISYETPTINPNQTFYIKKDLAVGSAVGYIGALDPNGGSIIFLAAPTTPQLFTVENSGAIVTSALLILDTQILTITATNSGGLSTNGSVTIVMESILLDQSFTINSNTKSNIVFASVLIDGNITEYILAISSNAPPTFAITSNNLSYTGTLGAIGNIYTIGVTATKGSVVHSATMTITVTNDVLFRVVPDQVFTIDTNHSTVGNVSYDNPSGGTIAFTTATSDERFTLSSTGLLTIAGDNPGPGTYPLTITTTTPVTTASITVIILSNAVIIQNAEFTISTYYGASNLIGTLFASDIDGLPIVLSLSSDSPSSAQLSDFTIINNNQLSTSDSFTHLEIGTLNFKVEGSDMTHSIGSNSTAKITVNVVASSFDIPNQTFTLPNSINAGGPQTQSLPFSMLGLFDSTINASTGTTFGPIVSLNPDNIPLTYAITSVLPVSTAFSIDSETGIITVSSPDTQLQNSYQIIVSATSADNITKNATITVFITQGSSLLANFPLTLNPGQKATIPVALLQGNLDTTFTITISPVSGNILNNGVVVTTFRQSDINNGLISYQNTSMLPGLDNFVFYTSDNATVQTFQITISPPAFSRAQTWIAIGVLGALGVTGVTLGGIALSKIRVPDITPPIAPPPSSSVVKSTTIEAMPGFEMAPAKSRAATPPKGLTKKDRLPSPSSYLDI